MNDPMTTDVINAAMQDPAPRIAATPKTSVELLLGISTINGRATNAVVREMNGEDEEFMASMDSRASVSYPEYISSLLKRTVVSIGDVSVAQSPAVVDDLIVGDRDLLFLAVVEATYGPSRNFVVICGSCGQEGAITVDMAKDFPMQGTAEDAHKPIIVTLRDGSSRTFRLPTGGDTKVVSKRGKTVAEQNTLMIAQCVQQDASISHAAREQWARSLNIADRNAIVNALVGTKVGPQVGEVNDPCPHCGETISAVLDWVSLLFG